MVKITLTFNASLRSCNRYYYCEQEHERTLICVLIPAVLIQVV